MILYSDKRFISNSEYPDTDWIGDADYVIHDESELAEKIKQAYPYFEYILDDDRNIVGIKETERPPVVPTISQEQRLTAAENAIEEIINLIMGG